MGQPEQMQGGGDTVSTREVGEMGIVMTFLHQLIDLLAT